MNDELDIIDRLVDYHDHISAPPVPVADDVRRGRRRVRRHRGMVAGGIALGVASVVAAVALSTVGTGEHTGPAVPSTTGSTSDPTPDGLGLTAPLVAPTSLRDVRDFGFHVEPVPGFDPEGLQAGWALDAQGQRVSLRWGQIADVVNVDVRYQGAPPPGDVYTETDPNLYTWDRREEVTVHGAVGYYYEEHNMYGIGAFRALVAWSTRRTLGPMSPLTPTDWIPDRRGSGRPLSRSPKRSAPAVTPCGCRSVWTRFRPPCLPCRGSVASA